MGIEKTYGLQLQQATRQAQKGLLRGCETGCARCDDVRGRRKGRGVAIVFLIQKGSTLGEAVFILCAFFDFVSGRGLVVEATSAKVHDSNSVARQRTL